MSTNFSPTPAELNLVNQIFKQADPQQLGVLTGEVAVKVFGGAKLPPTTLGEIWNISDEDNKGWLPKKGVAIAVRLIGWAQKGEKVTQALTNKPGPLAVIDGINTVAQQTTGVPISKSPPPSFPPLTSQDKAKFQSFFMNQGPVNGLLTGEKARDIFVKSKLSNEQLLKIWNLADTQDRGALDSTDFAIGMYFIQGIMSGKISFIPSTLPPGLYQQAGGASTTGSIRSQVTGNSGSFSPVNSIFTPQLTGNQGPLQPDYTGFSQPFRAPNLPARPSPHTNGHTSDWDVTPAEKATSDSHFDTLDTQKLGYIEGDVAVPFMLKSNLPGEVLAQVWDLADINNDGRLTRDGFAIAMHLIKKKLAGQEVPVTLPQSLVPPSARAAAQASSPFSPAYNQTQHQHQPQPEKDLFSFDDTPPASAVHPPLQATFTGTLQPQSTGARSSAFAPAPISQPIASDPFSSGPFQTTPQHDLLSDDESHTPAHSPPLQDRSAEIGNAKNQLQSTTRSFEAAKQEREALEQNLANQASQLSSIQTQLSLAKASYETETNLLATLKERRAGQVAEIDKSRTELITAESNLSALRAEKAEIEGAFLRDKEEARDLHKRMIEVGQQAENLKADVEKLKKEAKQQKGLLAIARKQLSTKEAEKAKAEKEHEEAVSEVTSLSEEKHAVDAEIERLDAAASIPKVASPSPSASLLLAASQPLPVTPEVSSPSKSNNPFERLVMSGSPAPQQTPSFIGLANTIVSSPPLSISDATPPPAQAADSTESAAVEAPKSDFTSFDDFTSSLAHNDSEPTELSYLGDGAEGNAHQEKDDNDSPATATSANEFFATPPTSAVNDNSKSPSLAAAERFPSIHDIATPPLVTEEAPKAVETAAPVAVEKTQTDLSTQLKDLDVEESDSDDDIDSDDEPLYKSAIAQGKARAVDPVPAPAAVEVDSKPAALSPSPIPTQAPVPVPTAPEVSFDDVFGTSEQPAAVKSNGFATPFDSTPFAPQTEPAPVAGVNEFDATLGKLANSTSATPAHFSFESSFEDTFDFSPSSQPPPSQVPAASSASKEAGKNEFDSIFGATSPAAFPPVTASPSQAVNKTAANPTPSFEEAFGGFDSITAPKLEHKVDAKPSSPVVLSDAGMPGSFPSSPTQSLTPAITQPRVSDIRATSPTPRAWSPPPRTTSPAPRGSSSLSHKDVQEKGKEAPTRHSKLSIRLPFGRKKKHSEPLPSAPAQHLTPPQERISRTGTPASDDDVEPVKQLTAMGFSRTQAVDALEIHGYDVQKALNSLLGSQ